jgi:hypothetical protein
MLDISSAYGKLQSSTAEIIYGEILWVPGELLVPPALKVETSFFIQQLFGRMDRDQPQQHASHPLPNSSTETSRI